MTEDVLARVETVRPGDVVYLPRGRRRIVERVEMYDDGKCAVVYRTGRSSSFAFGEERLATPNVLLGLRTMRVGERVRCRRAESHDGAR